MSARALADRIMVSIVVAFALFLPVSCSLPSSSRDIESRNAKSRDTESRDTKNLNTEVSSSEPAIEARPSNHQFGEDEEVLSSGSSSHRAVVEVARIAFHDWAIARDIPYEIRDSEVGLSGETEANVAMLVVVEDYHVGSAAPTRYVQVGVTLKKYGDEWRAETPIRIEDPFGFEVFSAEDEYAEQCMPELTRSSETFPCLRIINRSSFVLKGDLTEVLGRCIIGGEASMKLAPGQYYDFILQKKWFDTSDCGEWEQKVYIQMHSGDDFLSIFHGSVSGGIADPWPYD